jgi:hypothetical protein
MFTSFQDFFLKLEASSTFHNKPNIPRYLIKVGLLRQIPSASDQTTFSAHYLFKLAASSRELLFFLFQRTVDENSEILVQTIYSNIQN